MGAKDRRRGPRGMPITAAAGAVPVSSAPPHLRPVRGMIVGCFASGRLRSSFHQVNTSPRAYRNLTWVPLSSVLEVARLSAPFWLAAPSMGAKRQPERLIAGSGRTRDVRCKTGSGCGPHHLDLLTIFTAKCAMHDADPRPVASPSGMRLGSEMIASDVADAAADLSPSSTFVSFSKASLFNFRTWPLDDEATHL